MNKKSTIFMIAARSTCQVCAARQVVWRDWATEVCAPYSTGAELSRVTKAAQIRGPKA